MHDDHAEGFTLIELLVVIAVLAILVGLVLLVADPFQKSSEAASCRSEIDSLHTANVAYIAKHGSNAPSDDALVDEGYLQRPPKYATLTNGMTDPPTASGCDLASDPPILALTPGTGVSGMSATAEASGASGGWKTVVSLTVLDGDAQAVSGVQVVGTWTDGTNARRCTTGSSGSCSFNTHHDDGTSSATWTVSTVGGEAGDNTVSAVTCTKSPFGCS